MSQIQYRVQKATSNAHQTILAMLLLASSSPFVGVYAVHLQSSKLDAEGHNRILQSPIYDLWKINRGSQLYEHEQFIGNEDLGQGVHVHWKINEDKLNVAVIANADGWVGFGIGEVGGMPGSDIAIYTAVDDTLTDTHALAYATPMVDDCQNWDLVHSEVDDGMIIFEAIRDLDTGDLQDRAILDDSYIETPSHHVLVAWGDSDAYVYHGQNRATGALRFHQDPFTISNFARSWTDMGEEQYFTKNITVENFKVPAIKTTYMNFCFNSTADQLHERDVHITKMSFIEDPDTVGYLHHAILFGSKTENDCSKKDLLYVWAPGTEDFILPPEAGYRMGKNGYKSFVLNVHYDNPGVTTNIVDSSGVQFYYTNRLREHDAAILQFGDPNLALRKDGKSATLGGGNGKIAQWDITCPQSCMNEHLQDQTITVFSEVLHMHKFGASMKHEHIRDGSVLREQHVDYYDFDIAGCFSATQVPFEVEAGDSFKTSCYYESNDDVRFGIASNEEMCITWYMYYPAIPDFDGYCSLPLDDPKPTGNCEADYTSKLIDERHMGRTFGTPCSYDQSSDISFSTHRFKLNTLNMLQIKLSGFIFSCFSMMTNFLYL